MIIERADAILAFQEDLADAGRLLSKSRDWRRNEILRLTLAGEERSGVAGAPGTLDACVVYNVSQWQ